MADFGTKFAYKIGLLNTINNSLKVGASPQLDRTARVGRK
jgi:hypothetical protein